MITDTLESLGFEVKEGEHLYDRHDYLAGLDQDRAADVNAMFADDEVDAVITLRGGYGSARSVPYLDYDLIRNNPKVFTDFSDISYRATWAHRFSLEQVLAERCLELGIPAITGLMIGHIDDLTTVPLGCQAELDVEAGTLAVLEAAVV